MKGDVKREIDKGIAYGQNKVKSGVEYIKGATPDDLPAQPGDQLEQATQISPQGRPMLTGSVPKAETSELNPQSKWVPKYCPYCGGPLAGLFSCGDDETSLLSDDDEGKENVEEEVDVLNERPSRYASQRMPTQRNVQTSQANDKEDIEEVQQGADDEDENYKPGPEAPGRSEQSIQQRDPSLRQKGRQNPQSQNESEPNRSSKPVHKYCPYCASPITGSVYCPNCGNKVK